MDHGDSAAAAEAGHAPSARAVSQPGRAAYGISIYEERSGLPKTSMTQKALFELGGPTPPDTLSGGTHADPFGQVRPENDLHARSVTARWQSHVSITQAGANGRCKLPRPPIPATSVPIQKGLFGLVRFCKPDHHCVPNALQRHKGRGRNGPLRSRRRPLRPAAASLRRCAAARSPADGSAAWPARRRAS
jgi:hypothetical protein